MSCQPTECRYLSQASHLVAALSRNGTVRRVDRLRPGALGYAAGALDGRRLHDLVAEEDRTKLARALARCATGEPVWESLALRSADGRREPMLCCFQPMRESGGDLLVTGVRLGWAESEAEAATAAALAALALECHRPVHRLMQAIEAARAAHPKSEAAQRCRRDLDGLVDALSRSAQGPAPTGVAATDVVRILEAVVRRLDRNGALGRMEVILSASRAAAWATVHPVGLALVAMHLATNSREAAARARHPWLRISIHEEEACVQVEFADNGRGMERQDTANVFAPFFRRGRSKGLGLGLATCRQLVRWMGGTIRLQSRKGQGTLVRLSLPAATPPV